jgi:hypothetical protein
MTTYPISTEQKQNETRIINTILRNNGYTSYTKSYKKKTPSNTTPKETRKWATFSYIGKEVRTITKLFRNTEIRIAYKTRNTIQHLLQLKENNDPDIYNHSGIYEISCKSCNLKYIGQTGRSFRIRYKEHLNAIHSNTNSKYAHTYWKQDTHMARSKIHSESYIGNRKVH